ncbi:MAG: hypothetical protein PF484_11135 [Bacteroidales bacterium]|jgi:hypothetical protein|nr:hypothetical protein [Bacteroidales bacterium]
MKWFFGILFIFIFHSSSIAFQPTQPIGARALAMGGISLLPADFWSVFNNQAGLGSQTNWAFGFAYDSYFGLDKNLSLKSGAFLIPTNSGTFGLTLNYFGYSAYHEQKIGLAFGKSLSKVFSVGIQIDYISISIGNDYGRAGAFTFEIGVLAKLSESLQIASHIYNPYLVKIGKVNPEPTPAVFKFAAAYKIDKDLLLLAEYEQRNDINGILKIGMEYHLVEQYFVRGGLSTNPNLFSFGFGLNINGFNIDFGSSYHQILGFSPKAALYYRIK